MCNPLFTKDEIDALPTILDVVEDISKIENGQILPMVSTVPSSPYFDEGRYNFVSEYDNRRIAHLMPTSQSPFTFFRGQSRYYAPCIPSLYRDHEMGNLPFEVEIAANRIKIAEFSLMLREHRVFAEVCHNTSVNVVTLAQHYGLTTEYLDITNSKWVAAFFAATGYDYETDTYYPVGRDYHDGYGVLYVSKSLDGKLPDEFYKRNVVIGYQYFARPTKQSSFGFKMAAGEDFNENAFFDKVFFRHDIEASRIVFYMSYQQSRFIPQDTLSRLARQIRESNVVTRQALSHCREEFYTDKDASFLDRVCAAKGWSIREDNILIAHYPKDELAAEWESWDKYGRKDIQERTLPLIAVSRFNLDRT